MCVTLQRMRNVERNNATATVNYKREPINCNVGPEPGPVNPTNRENVNGKST